LEDCDESVDRNELEVYGELEDYNKLKHCNESDYCDELKYYNLEEDTLMEKELQCLKDSNSEAPPLFTEEPDLQGMT